jgi:hypothetical protein
MASEIPDIPHNMRTLYRRFQRWRSAHTGRLPIPERLWTAAAKLAREHGVFATAKALHLEYGKLKQLAEVPVPALKGRVAKTPAALLNYRQAGSGVRSRGAIPRRGRPRSRPPAFVELLAPRPGSSRECRVELEGPRGRMRIEFKGIATAELVALSRALWDGESPTDQSEA